MKNDNQAALDLFSNYSDFMLTDDELLVIHGGTTQSGGVSSAPPPAAPPPAPAVSTATSPIGFVDRAVEQVTRDINDLKEAVQNSETFRALDDLAVHVVQVVDDFVSGLSSPSAGSGSGG